MNTEETLKDRGMQYGPISMQAKIIADMKKAITIRNLDPVKQHCMDMIIVKISRIINGNPNNVDSWRDIAGYAQLAGDSCVPPVPPPRHPQAYVDASDGISVPIGQSTPHIRTDSTRGPSVDTKKPRSYKLDPL